MKTKILNCVPPKTNKKILSKYYVKAKRLLCNEKKIEKFLLRLEAKIKKIPKCGNKLANVPIFASLLNNYLHKTYTKAPLGTIIAVVAALLYLVAPIDAFPDFIPFFGYFDDAGIMATCLALVKSDIEEYRSWRTTNLYY